MSGTTGESAVLGCKVRSGRAVAVLVSAGEGAPRLLDRRDLLLADPEDPATTQPYHAGFGTLEQDEARLGPRLQAVARAAEASVAQAVSDWGSQGLHVTAAALVVGSLTDPLTIRHPHMRAHGLEGRLFRSALAEALLAHGISATLFPERDLYQHAAEALGTTVPALKPLLSGIGRAAGKPWSTDHRLAAAAALALMASSTRGRAARGDR